MVVQWRSLSPIPKLSRLALCTVTSSGDEHVYVSDSQSPFAIFNFLEQFCQNVFSEHYR